MAVTMIVSSAPVRTAATCLRLMLEAFSPGKEIDSPSFGVMRLWTLRIGYYKLIRPVTKVDDDWILIVDFSVQIGPHKCFVVLGAKMSVLKQKRCLSLADVDVLMVAIMEKPTGDTVFEKLLEVVDRVGVPRAIIADGGSDLQAGIKAFVAKHPASVAIYDIAHKAAAELKRILASDPKWSLFVAAVHAFKLRIQQTPFAVLAPPAQRAKGRAMNFDVIMSWVKNGFMAAYTKPVVTAAVLGVDAIKLKDFISWFNDFEVDFIRWDELCLIVQITHAYIEQEGYHQGASNALEFLLPKPTTSDGLRLHRVLIDFVRTQSSCAKDGERLPGSSDVIESLFGKLKRFEGDHVKSGFSQSVLALAAMTSTNTPDLVKTALETSKVKDVYEWGREQIGTSVQAGRVAVRELSKTLFGKEEKWDRFHAVTT